MACFSCLRGRRRDTGTRRSAELDDEFPGVHKVNLYSYEELRIATNDFSRANKIGEGGFGCVYKGKLGNRKMGAIKVLSPGSRQGIRELLNEIEAISDIEHENLVQLYGCCVEGNQRILVYEYLENNSLAHTLLGEYCSKNIHISRGYLAPEYAIRGQVTRRSDIYSYGVLLMEIVTGQCNTSMHLPPEERHILQRAWKLYQRRELVTLVDASLEFDEEQACRFLKIGLLCTQDNPDLRPVMSNVVSMLTGEKNVDIKTEKPGLVPDVTDSKKRNNPRPKPLVNDKNTCYSSGSDALNNTSFTSALSSHDATFTSAPSSYATMSFTSIHDRSI